MLSPEECLKIMGLNENANIYDIENRYTTLLKRYRGQSDPETLAKVDEITLAYTILTGRYREKETPDPRLDEVVLGKTRRQWKNIWHYGRVPALVTILISAFVIYFAYTVITNEPPEFQVVLAGPFGMTDGAHDRMNTYIGEVMPELENYQHELIALDMREPDDEDSQEPWDSMGGVSDGVNPQNQYAYMMKLVTVMSADSVDIYVLDKDIFNHYAGQGAFVALDDFHDRLVLENPDLADLVEPQRRPLTYDEPLPDEYDPIATPTPGPSVEVLNADESLHVFGLDATDLDLTEGVGYYHDNIILAIGHRSQNIPRAESFLEQWLRDQEQMTEMKEAFEQEMIERYGS